MNRHASAARMRQDSRARSSPAVLGLRPDALRDNPLWRDRLRRHVRAGAETAGGAVRVLVIWQLAGWRWPRSDPDPTPARLPGPRVSRHGTPRPVTRIGTGS